MFNAKLFTIVEPKEEGKNPRLYYVEGNHFSTNEDDGIYLQVEKKLWKCKKDLILTCN